MQAAKSSSIRTFKRRRTSISNGAALTRFFGEREETFLITPRLIVELERVTGAGIGSLFKSLADSRFAYADIRHVIRLGLIGGGVSPELAASLCDAYVDGRPILETYPLALAILERLWLGAPAAEALVSEVMRGDDAAA